jgi:hypothetical protein
MTTALAVQDRDYAPLLDAIDELTEVEIVQRHVERGLVAGFAEEGRLSVRVAMATVRRFCDAVLGGFAGETDVEVAARVGCSVKSLERARADVERLGGSLLLRERLLHGSVQDDD